MYELNSDNTVNPNTIKTILPGFIIYIYNINNDFIYATVEPNSTPR